MEVKNTAIVMVWIKGKVILEKNTAGGNFSCVFMCQNVCQMF